MSITVIGLITLSVVVSFPYARSQNSADRLSPAKRTSAAP